MVTNNNRVLMQEGSQRNHTETRPEECSKALIGKNPAYKVPFIAQKHIGHMAIVFT